MGIHQVATHSKHLLITYVKVKSEALCVFHTIDAAKPTETPVAGHRKRHLVDIVSAGKNSELIVVDKAVNHKIARISVVGAVTHSCIAKPPLFHSLLDSKVNHRFIFAVVYPGETCEVAFAVHHLDFIHHLYRDIF